MIEQIWDSTQQALVLQPNLPQFWGVVIRAFVIYIAVLILVRFGDKRFLGKNTAFDVVLGVILGSTASRAINGSAPFFATLAAGAVLVGLHWLFAALAFRYTSFGDLVKGETRLLVKDGQIRWDQMRASHITKSELLDAVRSQLHTESLAKVDDARLERSGNVSIITQEKQPTVLEVRVAEGVQTIRIQLE